MPVDVGAHRAQIARWNTELAAAEKALHHASPLRDLRKPAELQAHLFETVFKRRDTGPRGPSGCRSRLYPSCYWWCCATFSCLS